MKTSTELKSNNTSVINLPSPVKDSPEKSGQNETMQSNKTIKYHVANPGMFVVTKNKSPNNDLQAYTESENVGENGQTDLDKFIK